MTDDTIAMNFGAVQAGAQALLKYGQDLSEAMTRLEDGSKPLVQEWVDSHSLAAASWQGAQDDMRQVIDDMVDFAHRLSKALGEAQAAAARHESNAANVLASL